MDTDVKYILATQRAMDEFATKIAVLYIDCWPEWVVFLLARLDIHADNQRLYDGYKACLRSIQRKIQRRLDTGRWL